MIATLQARLVSGLQGHLGPLGVTAVIERDQDAPAPARPYVGIKWLSVTPESGSPRRTRRAVPSDDPRWIYDVEFCYPQLQEVVLSLTVFDVDSDRIHGLTEAAHRWFLIPELAGDWLESVNAVVIQVLPIGERGNMLDREVERRQGFDVRLRVGSESRVTVPTIERVEITGIAGKKQTI